MNRKIHQVALAVVTTTVIGSAYAAESAENDALAITGAKISLTQAVAAAEQHVGGQASKAKYEHEKGQTMFDVEVVKDKRVMDVKIDPMTGQVIASTEDKADQGEDKAGHNEEDEQDD